MLSVPAPLTRVFLADVGPGCFAIFVAPVVGEQPWFKIDAPQSVHGRPVIWFSEILQEKKVKLRKARHCFDYHCFDLSKFIEYAARR